MIVLLCSRLFLLHCSIIILFVLHYFVLHYSALYCIVEYRIVLKFYWNWMALYGTRCNLLHWLALYILYRTVNIVFYGVVCSFLECIVSGMRLTIQIRLKYTSSFRAIAETLVRVRVSLVLGLALFMVRLKQNVDFFKQYYNRSRSRKFKISIMRCFKFLKLHPKANLKAPITGGSIGERRRIQPSKWTLYCLFGRGWRWTVSTHFFVWIYEMIHCVHFVALHTSGVHAPMKLLGLIPSQKSCRKTRSNFNATPQKSHPGATFSWPHSYSTTSFNERCN